MMNKKELALGLRALAVFRPLLQDRVVARLLVWLEAGAGTVEAVDAHCALASELYAVGGDLGSYLLERIMECDNPVARLRAAGKEVPACMQAAMERELAALSRIAASGEPDVSGAPLLPVWASTPHDLAARYEERLSEANTKGFGVFAAYHMFTLGEHCHLLPVKNPDPQRLGELTGYERERGEILVNTKALLGGLPANNILLYGDAGTGKSSTVKALANEFKGRGLRLIEVRKNQLYQIPELMDKLADNPLKFIVFIDDLSFASDDSDFTALKAILEGNVAARPGNIVVYATSNRRHMVKEKYSDRLGDDMHLADTLEEETSLSARFGLTITFLKPDRELYAEIVKAVALERGLETPVEELLAKAEAHAIRHGGRSPRTARQFVEAMIASERFA